MTLAELLVALTLSGLLLASLLELFGVLPAHQRAQRAGTAQLRTEGNARLALGFQLLHAEVGPDSGYRFLGTDSTVEFVSRCRDGGGWWVPCTVEWRLNREANGVLLASREDRTEWQPAALFPATARFVFLSIPDGSADWQRSWGGRVDGPAAVAVVTHSDTVVLAGRAP